MEVKRYKIIKQLLYSSYKNRIRIKKKYYIEFLILILKAQWILFDIKC